MSDHSHSPQLNYIYPQPLPPIKNVHSLKIYHYPPPPTIKQYPPSSTHPKYVSTHPTYFHQPIKNIHPPLPTQNIPLPTPTHP